MSIKNLVAATVAALALPIISSCVVAARPGVVYVRTRPPAIQTEVIGVSPGPGYVWIRGYHRWENNAYVWVPGRWELPPRARGKWVEGRWHHDRYGWYWVEGHWR